MSRGLLLFGLCLVSVAGCASLELEHDQDKIRTALLELYTNQIMDNLIRAHNGMPIIQMDYQNATATVTVKESGSLNVPVASTSSNVFTLAAASMLVATRTAASTVTTTLGIDHSNQISLLGTPVTTSDAVYDAYEEFLRNDGLRVSCQPPPAGAAHLCRCCNGSYYWVPVEYQREFLRLALATTAQRAQPAAPPDAFYSVNIVKVLRAEQIMAAAPSKKEADPPLNPLLPPPLVVSTAKPQYWLTLKLDKKIPIDEGYMDVSSADKSSATKQTAAPAGSGKTGGGKGSSSSPSAKGDSDLPSDQKPAPPATASGQQTASQSGLLYIFGQPDGQKRRSGTTDVVRVLFDENNPPSNVKDFETFRASINAQQMAAKVYLHHHRPTAVVETNNRVEFYLQQIQQGQFRNNNSGF